MKMRSLFVAKITVGASQTQLGGIIPKIALKKISGFQMIFQMSPLASLSIYLFKNLNEYTGAI